jgi:hypothetical protein
MVAFVPDEVELVRLLGAPFAGGRELRDAVETIVNGDRLSELLGGAALDVDEIRDCLADAWLWGGRNVTVGRCVCGDVECIRALANINRRGPIVEWDVPSIDRTFRFLGADMERSLRRALSESP